MKTKIIKISNTTSDLQAICDAALIIKNGGLVAFPTETVYGLGADATDKNAAQKIYSAKGRPSDNPLIIHIRGLNKFLIILNKIKNTHPLLFGRVQFTNGAERGI